MVTELRAHNKDLGVDPGIYAALKAANTASYVLIGKILTFLMTGIALVLITRILGPSQYGIYALAVAFASIFGSIGYFGIGTAMSKFIAEYRQGKKLQEVNNVISNALFMIVVAGVVLSLISFALNNLVAYYVFHNSSLSYVIKIVSFYIITSMLFGSVYDTLLGFGQGKQIAIVASIEAVLQAAISIILAIMGFGAIAPILGLIIGYFAGFAVGISMILRQNRVRLCRPSAKYMLKILNFSFPVAMSNISGNLLSSFGLVFLGYFVLPGLIGNASAATRVGALVSIVFDSISFALLPAFSAALADPKTKNEIGRFYGYVVYLAIALVSPMLLYMTVFSTPFSGLIFGSNYTYAPLFISIISIGLLLGVAGSYASTILISASRVRLVFKYNVAINLIVLLLLVFIVPYFDGIAYITIIYIVSPLIGDFFFIRELSKMFKVKLRFNKFIRLIVAGLITSAVAAVLYLFLSNALLLAGAVITYILLYPILATLLKGADRGDINTIKEISIGIPFVGRALAAIANYAEIGLR